MDHKKFIAYENYREQVVYRSCVKVKLKLHNTIEKNSKKYYNKRHLSKFKTINYCNNPLKY